MSKKTFNLILFWMICSLALAQSWHLGGGKYSLNGISFSLQPEAIIVHGNAPETLAFSATYHSYADSSVATYSHPQLQLIVKISDHPSYHVPAKQVEVFTQYFDDLKVQNLSLQPRFLNAAPEQVLRGPDAIMNRDPSKNKNLYPFTNRVLEYVFEDASLWIAAANYQGTANVNWLSETAVHFFDHALHFARMYDPTSQNFNIRADRLKRIPTDTDYYSFLIFEALPPLLNISLWPDGKDAALVITNDADGESPDRMRAVYFGSSNPQSPKYMNQGIIANNIKLTNTVFGASQPVMASLWHELMNYGISIGLHTFGNYADLSEDTYQGLIYDLAEFNIRSWIDHSWGINPDCICHEGWNPDSPYYVLNAINDSNVDYIWLGDASYTNPINSFTEPWRLPHKLYEFDHLTRPVVFFGRTLMGTWEALDHNYLTDMKHNLTPENLDQLLSENGLTVIYTHFFFTETASLIPFYETLPNGNLEIRDEANAAFAMLDYYQKYRGLWIDTLEAVLDRMMAIEAVKIQGSSYEPGSNQLRISLKNGSEYSIPDFCFVSEDNIKHLYSLSPQQEISFFATESSGSHSAPYLDFLCRYQDGRLHFTHKNIASLPALNIDIYNIKGQKVCSQYFHAGIHEAIIPFFGRPSGIYLAKIRLPSGFEKTFKMTVVK